MTTDTAVPTGLDLLPDELSGIDADEQRQFIEVLDTFMADNGQQGRSLVPQGEVINLCLDLRNLIRKYWTAND